MTSQVTKFLPIEVDLAPNGKMYPTARLPIILTVVNDANEPVAKGKLHLGALQLDASGVWQLAGSQPQADGSVLYPIPDYTQDAPDGAAYAPGELRIGAAELTVVRNAVAARAAAVGVVGSD